MPIVSKFPMGGGSGSTGGIAVGAVSGVSTLVASGKVYIKWTDPDDVVYNDIQLATWAGTTLVRKIGSAPVDRHDGTTVLTSVARDEYKSKYFEDSGLSNGVTYYYKFFPYTTDGTYTDSEDNKFTATPTAQVNGISNWRVTNMSASTEAGNGKMTVKWTDPASTITSDGVTLATWGSTTIVVKADSYATSKNDSAAAYTLKVTTRNRYASSALTITGLTNGTKYYISFFPETTDGGINTNTAQRITGTANKITISTVPSQSGTLNYHGSSQTPSWSNYDSSKMTLSVVAQTNAGTYTATFTPKSDYRWSDGTTTAKKVEWTIDKAETSIESVSDREVVLNPLKTSATITVRSLGGKISAVSDNESVASVSILSIIDQGLTVGLFDTVISINSVNNNYGSATITISAIADANHYVSENYGTRTVSVFADFDPDIPAVGTPLNDCSWEGISKIATKGLASSYFAIGDLKAITINGSIGGYLDIDNDTYYVYILGFEHNGATNTIDFGTFKTLLGDNICLVDSKYGTGTTGRFDFSMNHYRYNNYGGWKGCDLRYDILGSTDVAPSDYKSTDETIRRYGYDASENCATNPIPNTFMAALPEDLRSVMKPMTIYTDNAGDNVDNLLQSISSSIDYLPLLASYEIYGQKDGNEYEMNYQKQYSYFSAGNKKLKYSHNETSKAVSYTLRSPRTKMINSTNSGSFACVDQKYSEQYAMGNSASISYGVSPIFRV